MARDQARRPSHASFLLPDSVSQLSKAERGELLDELEREVLAVDMDLSMDMSLAMDMNLSVDMDLIMDQDTGAENRRRCKKPSADAKLFRSSSCHSPLSLSSLNNSGTV